MLVGFAVFVAVRGYRKSRSNVHKVKVPVPILNDMRHVVTYCLKEVPEDDQLFPALKRIDYFLDWPDGIPSQGMYP